MTRNHYYRTFVSFILLCFLSEIGLFLYFNFDKMNPDAKLSNNNGDMVETIQLTKRATVVSLDSLRETLERPLFTQYRTAVTKNVESKVIATSSNLAPNVLSEPLAIQVIGILLLEENRLALVRRNKDSPTEWISLHDKVSGWTLEKILPTQIFLRNGDRIEKISLEIKYIFQKGSLHLSRDNSSKRNR